MIRIGDKVKKKNSKSRITGLAVDVYGIDKPTIDKNGELRGVLKRGRLQKGKGYIVPSILSEQEINIKAITKNNSVFAFFSISFLIIF